MNLEKFCGATFLHSTERPFSSGEWTYATDGKIMVRVPRLADVPERIEAPKNASKLFAEHTAYSAFQPLSNFLIPPTVGPTICENCKGRGQVICDKCCNDGECDKCEGGKVPEIPIRVVIGTQGASHIYLNLISNLPGIEIANGAGEHSALVFRFNGGQGLLMPLLP